MNIYQRFIRWCQRPSMINVTRARFFSRLSKMDKDDYLTAFSVLLLLFTGLIDWNVYSWLVLLGIVLLILGWYFRK